VPAEWIAGALGQQACDLYLLLDIDVPWEPDGDPLDLSTFLTHAVNVPVRDGEVTKAELLLTPEANVAGMPANLQVLYSTLVPTGAGGG